MTYRDIRHWPAILDKIQREQRQQEQKRREALEVVEKTVEVPVQAPSTRPTRKSWLGKIIQKLLKRAA